MECLRSMKHMIYFFSLRDIRFYLLHFYITILKMFQADSPWGRGGFSFFCLFLKTFHQSIYNSFLSQRHRFGPPPSNWMLLVPYDPTVEKKKMYFLYLLDMHTTKPGYVLFVPHPIPPKEVLPYLFKDPQNKYFSWFPPPTIAK